MGGSALLHTISLTAVVVVFLLTAWVVLMLESGGDPSHAQQEPAKPSDEPGEATALEREAA
jgi:hypothetical protein